MDPITKQLKFAGFKHSRGCWESPDNPVGTMVSVEDDLTEVGIVDSDGDYARISEEVTWALIYDLCQLIEVPLNPNVKIIIE